MVYFIFAKINNLVLKKRSVLEPLFFIKYSVKAKGSGFDPGV